MKHKLPPLPPYASEFRPRWLGEPGGYSEAQMQAYATEAVNDVLAAIALADAPAVQHLPSDDTEGGAA